MNINKSAIFPALLGLCITVLLNGPFIANAQTKVSGRLYEIKTHTVLPGVRVENLRTHSATATDTAGQFTIPATVGDKLSFTVLSYKTDTLYLANLRFKEFYLTPRESKLLKEVTIVNKEVNFGALAMPTTTGPLGSKTVRYQTDANGNASGGVKFGLPDFSGMQKKREKEARMAAEEETAQRIDRIFSVESLQRYIPLKGQEMSNFRVLYRPSPGMYSSKFNLPIYVDSCYREFVKMPVADRQSKALLDLNKTP